MNDLPTSALAEWSAVCAGLASGATILTVRKGGIHERGGGLFAPEHRRFWLLPTFEHQSPARLKPAFAPLAGPDPSPGTRRLPGWCESVRTWRVTDPDRLDALGDLVPFTAAEVRARYLYREAPFLFVLALRVHAASPAASIPDQPRFAGCRSWIDIGPVPAAGSAPVLDDAAFAARLASVAAVLDHAGDTRPEMRPAAAPLHPGPKPA